MGRTLRAIWMSAAVSVSLGVLPAYGEESLLERARVAVRKAGTYWATKVASHGGYVWEYGTDLVTRRRGESRDLPLSTVWVQPPGTPAIGMVFLKAYEATGERPYLDAAVASARCLAWGQLESGGWTYSIEFDVRRNRHRYHHLDDLNYPDLKRLRNTTTFDDNVTQSATRLLMAVDQYVDDPKIDQAIERALKCFLTAQYKGGLWDGAWPQRYPPPKSYGGFPTYNDSTMSDCVRTMLAAYKHYGKPEHLDSVKRCLDFYLRSQQPDPQGAWAQQYDRNLKPARARRFEPASITGGESAGNVRLLLDMYIAFGDERYLDAAGRAVDWYKRSRIGGTEKRGIWARFYELGTNKPLYFTKTYKLVYTDDDLPIHYSFKGNWGIEGLIRRYEDIRKQGRAYYVAAAKHENTAKEWTGIARRSAGKANKMLAAQDAEGRWVRTVYKTEQVRDDQGRVVRQVDKKTKLHMMRSRTFVTNMSRLIEYIVAAQGGPAVKTDD